MNVNYIIAIRAIQKCVGDEDCLTVINYWWPITGKEYNLFKILPCIDSVEIAASRRQELDIPRDAAAELGRSALEAAVEGQYIYGDGRKVDWSRYV